MQSTVSNKAITQKFTKYLMRNAVLLDCPSQIIGNCNIASIYVILVRITNCIVHDL